MSEKRNGPRVKLSSSCFGCRHEQAESYAVQGDSGMDYYCEHPDVLDEAGRRRYIGGTDHTPDWCPLKVSAIEQFLRERGLA